MIVTDIFSPKNSFTAVLEMDAENAVKQNRDAEVLLMVWPDFHDEWPAQALRQFKGKTVIVVGEPSGCTGPKSMWEELFVKWLLKAPPVVNPRRWGSTYRDCITVWEPKHDGV
jgi:hypothetical protein